jgi:uncharacterized protein
MQNFTPWAGLAGGVLIGAAAALYLLAVGRLAGISGMLESVLRPTQPGFGVAAWFLLGLPLGALLTAVALPTWTPAVDLRGGAPLLLAAGLLVGFGTRLANGCTSGHGVCGLPRFSARSWLATGVFMTAAATTVFVVRHGL